MTKAKQTNTSIAEPSSDAPRNPKLSVTDTESRARIELQPGIKPPIVKLAITLLSISAIVGLLSTNPQLLGVEATEIVRWIAIIVGLLLIIRYSVTIFVLRRTRYLITEETIEREFTFLYRHRSRELPIFRLRGIELSRGRVQSALGYSDLRFLTGGVNRGLGYLSFENLPDGERQRETIRNHLFETVNDQ